MKDMMLARFVIICGVIVSSVIALTIIFAVAYILIKEPQNSIPDVIRDWGGLILGFYFGSFLGLIKDLVSRPEAENQPPKRGDESVHLLNR